mgnify:FL=1
MKNKIKEIAKLLNLSKEFDTLLLNDDIQSLSKDFDKDLDIVCFVRLRNKADIEYSDKQEIPLTKGFALAYSQDYINDFASKNNLNIELSALPEKILAVAKLSKKILESDISKTLSTDIEVKTESKKKKLK